MLGELLAASHLMPAELLPVRAAQYAEAAGFTKVLIYIGDLQRRVLRLLTGEGVTGEGCESEVPVDGTVAGRAYRAGEVVQAREPDTEGYHLWVPIIDGTERLGLLRVTSDHDDDRALEDIDRLASLVALIIVAKRDSSDALARIIRSRPMNVAAEMQWHLTPPRSYADGRVVISATMEPAYEISGDAFDYATDGPLVHLSIFDAMGHDTAAGLTANLAVGACRNARRQGADLVSIGERVERILIEQYDYLRYATGILATLDTRSGRLTWVNRGHPPPVVIRGARWGALLDCPPLHPMGTGLDLRGPPCRHQLEPGDRIVLYTDGITEARRRDGTEFGIERFTDFIIRRHADGLPVPETLRRLIDAVLEHHGGQLQDDATVVLCEWLGPTTTSTSAAAALTGLDDSLPQPGSGEGGRAQVRAELRMSTVELNERLAVVAVAGELDTSTAADAYDYTADLASSHPLLIMDLSEVTFCDSSGYNALLRLRRRATQADGLLVLAAPPAAIRHLLTLTGGQNAFGVYGSRAEALATLLPGDDTPGDGPD
jgi:anti-anti-sigma factor